EERTLKIVRRVGYVVLFGTAFCVFVPLILGVGLGIKQDRIWDPFTGHAVSRADSSISCLDEAQQLIVDKALDGAAAGSSGQVSGGSAGWDKRFSFWVARCRSEHNDVYDMLRSRRDGLRSGRGAESGAAVE